MGAALAGVVATPTDDLTDQLGEDLVGPLGAAGGSGGSVAIDGSATTAAAGRARPIGLMAGAAKSSIAPRPGDYGGRWERDLDLCRTLEPAYVEHLASSPEDLDHLASTGSPWPENPDCI